MHPAVQSVFPPGGVFIRDNQHYSVVLLEVRKVFLCKIRLLSFYYQKKRQMEITPCSCSFSDALLLLLVFFPRAPLVFVFHANVALVQLWD